MKVRIIVTLLMVSNWSWASGCEVSMGAVPQFGQRKLFSIWTPILNKLEEKISCKIKLLGSKSIAEFESNFLKGLYDLVYLNPYHQLMAQRSQKYRSILRSNDKKLKGILVVKNDASSDIKAIQGKSIAFPSPNALGASLLMRAELKGKKGIDFQELYVKTHDSVYLHVAKGLSYAGGGVKRTFDAQPDPIRKRLKIIYQTSEVFSHPLSAHPRLGDKTIKLIQKSLLAIAQDAPDLFEAIPMKNPVKAKNEDYDILASWKLEDYAAKR